jgi:hypothetical protein
MLFSCFMGHCPYVERSVVKTHGVEFLILSVKQNDAYFCLSGGYWPNVSGQDERNYTHAHMKTRAGRIDKANCRPASRSDKFVWMQFKTCAVQPYVLIHFLTHVKETYGRKDFGLLRWEHRNYVWFSNFRTYTKVSWQWRKFQGNGLVSWKEFPSVYSLQWFIIGLGFCGSTIWRPGFI